VTGAARGIGRELALQLSGLGCNVICVDLNAEGNLRTAQDIVKMGHKAQAYTCDVSDSAAVEELSKKVGYVDILVNNAGIIFINSILKTQQSAVSKILEVNVASHFAMIRNFLPEMLARNKGHIVGVASCGGLIGLNNASLYSSSKFAVIVSIVKMATPQMKAQTVLWYAEFKSIVRVQREYRRVFNHDAPTAKSIKKWHDTGSVLKKLGGGRRTSDEMVANVQAAYERSPRKSLRRASRELQVPKSTLQRIVQKRLKLYAYKVQLIQRLEPDDKPKRVEFVNTMLDRFGADPDFMSKIFFSFFTFHVPGKVYATPVRDLRDLPERIIEAIESIPEDMLQRTWQEIVYRLDIITVTAGAHVEIW
ncbi:hypothetical protein ANN_08105, partial [Periplaneta americana]